jgi:LPS export ABC transporter protein LptC
MTVTTTPPAAGAPRRTSPTGRGIVLNVDRSVAFARARRHSLFVRTARVLLPLASLLLVAGYVGIVMISARLAGGIEKTGKVRTISKEFAMENPRYEGMDQQGGKFLVLAKRAVPDLSTTGRIKLDAITAELVDVRKSRTDVTAANGVYDSKANRLDLAGGITVVTETGMRAELETATILTRDGTLKSDRPARVTAPTGTITSGRLELAQKSKQIAFIDNVVARLTPPAQLPKGVLASADPAAAVEAAPSAIGGFAASRAPVDITADRLDVDDAKRTATFSGQVRATQAGSTIETEQLVVSYLGGAAEIGGAPAPTAGGTPSAQAGAAGGRIERIVSPGPVVMTQPNGNRVTGRMALFDAVAETAEIEGNVTLSAGADRTATADRLTVDQRSGAIVLAGKVAIASGPDARTSSDRADIDQKADTYLLTGNVIVTQGGNELRGRRLAVDRKSGRTELSSPADGAAPKSRIFARLVQNAQAGGKKAGSGKAAKPPEIAAEGEAAAAGAAGGLGMATFRTDPNAPVDVEADKLVVEDTRKEATFSGDVRAAQGDFLIRSSDLKASYTGDTGLMADGSGGTAGSLFGGGGGAATSGGQTTPTGQPPKPKTPTQLSRIDARGKVVVTSKANQQVTGDWAVFDTKASTVTIGGTDVVLTQGPNVVKGNKLVIDMPTGQSRITRDGPAPVAGSGQPVAPPGRSNLVLYPSTMERAKKAKPPEAPGDGTQVQGAGPGQAAKSAQPTNPSSSSWGTSTAPSTPN